MTMTGGHVICNHAPDWVEDIQDWISHVEDCPNITFIGQEFFDRTIHVGDVNQLKIILKSLKGLRIDNFDWQCINEKIVYRDENVIGHSGATHMELTKVVLSPYLRLKITGGN